MDYVLFIFTSVECHMYILRFNIAQAQYSLLMYFISNQNENCIVKISFIWFCCWYYFPSRKRSNNYIFCAMSWILKSSYGPSKKNVNAVYRNNYPPIYSAQITSKKILQPLFLCNYFLKLCKFKDKLFMWNYSTIVIILKFKEKFLI